MLTVEIGLFCTNYSAGAAMAGMGAAFLSCFNCVLMAGVAHFAFASSGRMSIHGCIYGIKDGRWKSLNTTISGFEQLPPQYRLRPLGEA